MKGEILSADVLPQMLNDHHPIYKTDVSSRRLHNHKSDMNSKRAQVRYLAPVTRGKKEKVLRTFISLRPSEARPQKATNRQKKKQREPTKQRIA